MDISIAFLFIIAVVGLAVFTSMKYGKAEAERLFSSNHMSVMERTFYAVGSVWLRKSGVYPLIISYVPQIVRYCSLVNRREEQTDPAYLWTVKAFTLSLGSLAAGIASLLLNADLSIVVLFFILTLFIPLALYRDLAVSVRKKREAFVSELPSFMQKLALLLSAGETIQRAWIRAADVPKELKNHPLYEELALTINALKQSVPFTKVLEDLHQRCAVPEMSSLVTTVLMNYRRGGEAFVMALQDASRTLMERKYAVIRTKGEEASTKLLFPMMLMLFAVILIVGAPAVMLMN